MGRRGGKDTSGSILIINCQLEESRCQSGIRAKRGAGGVEIAMHLFQIHSAFSGPQLFVSRRQQNPLTGKHKSCRFYLRWRWLVLLPTECVAFARKNDLCPARTSTTRTNWTELGWMSPLIPCAVGKWSLVGYAVLPVI